MSEQEHQNAIQSNLKSRLDRNIWITRKCRINASERLLRDAKYIEFLNVYYSILVIGLSLLSLLNHNDNLSLVSTLFSIALTISIIYANTTSMRERSCSLKQNYIDLQTLLDQLSYIQESDASKILDISNKYSELLKNSENHATIDLYRLKYSSKKEDHLALTLKEWIKLIWLLASDTIIKIFFLIAPIIALIYYYRMG